MPNHVSPKKVSKVVTVITSCILRSDHKLTCPQPVAWSPQSKGRDGVLGTTFDVGMQRRGRVLPGHPVLPVSSALHSQAFCPWCCWWRRLPCATGPAVRGGSAKLHDNGRNHSIGMAHAASATGLHHSSPGLRQTCVPRPCRHTDIGICDATAIQHSCSGQIQLVTRPAVHRGPRAKERRAPNVAPFPDRGARGVP